MMTTCTNPQPLDFGTSNPRTFKVCTFLVNVLSHMYDQWVKAGKPKPDQFKWQPVNACPVTSDFKVTDYAFFGKLIWSTFTWLGSKRTEPFGGIFKSNADNSLYLIFRGSKTFADFCVDAEAGLEPYKAPITPVPSDTRVEQGWYKVYIGLRDTLLTQLSQIGTAQPLTITGHSLGKRLIALSIPRTQCLTFQGHRCTLGMYTSALKCPSTPIMVPRRKHTTRVAATPMQSTTRISPAIQRLTPATCQSSR